MHRLSFRDALDAGRLLSLPTIGALADLFSSAVCAQPSALGHATPHRTARAPIVGKLSNRPASSASRNESLCMKRVLGVAILNCSKNKNLLQLLAETDAAMRAPRGRHRPGLRQRAKVVD